MIEKLTSDLPLILKFVNVSGAYAPLTVEGNLVVDGVLASSYGSFPHGLAHAALAPLRWWWWYPGVLRRIFRVEERYPAVKPGPGTHASSRGTPNTSSDNNTGETDSNAGAPGTLANKILGSPGTLGTLDTLDGETLPAPSAGTPGSSLGSSLVIRGSSVGTPRTLAGDTPAASGYVRLAEQLARHLVPGVMQHDGCVFWQKLMDAF